MNLQHLSESLSLFLEASDNLFLTVETDISDFRNTRPVKINVSHGLATYSFVLEANPRLGSASGILSNSIFAENRRVFGWNVKDLFSWLKFHCDPVPFSGKIYDLRVCEAFNGITAGRPKDYFEAWERLKTALENKKLEKMNEELFTPLNAEVLPAIETRGLYTDRTKSHSSYSVEGSMNGRLSARVAFDGAFNPHGLTGDQKNEFRAERDNVFLVLDYEGMEVSTLAWLSKDERLLEVTKTDPYAETYKAISGAKKCSAENREWTKKVLLPVIYGCGPDRLAKYTGFTQKAAETIIQKLTGTYPEAFEYLEAVQEEAKGGKIVDPFGRVYSFANREPYKARNAIVQGSGSTACLSKLVELYNERIVSLVANVHDAYVCVTPRGSVEKVARRCKSILESESKIAPGLAMTVNVKVGDKWGEVNLTEIENDKD